MKNPAKFAAVVGSLAALAVVGSLMPEHSGAASTMQTQPVLVTNNNSQPLPISGTVTGSVGASQAGTWNVGISGTPSVNIANATPVAMTGSVAIVGTPSVSLANTGDDPVPTTLVAVTRLLADQTLAENQAGFATFDPVDVSSAREVRITCTASSSDGTSNQIFVNFDHFVITLPSPQEDNTHFTQVVELPGTRLQVRALGGLSPTTVSCQVYGRAN